MCRQAWETLTSRVRVVQDIRTSVLGEQVVRCRLAEGLEGTMGMIEITDNGGGYLTATSVNQPDASGEIIVRVLNVLEEVHIPAGTCIATHTVLDKSDIIMPNNFDEQEEAGQQQVSTVDTSTVVKLPQHLQALFEGAKRGCESAEERQLANLLYRYRDVFSAN